MLSDFRLYKRGWVSSTLSPHLHSYQPINKLKEYLKRGGWFIKNTYDFDCNEETAFWYVIKDHFGGLEELSPKVRNQVRKSLKTYDIRLATKEEMLHYGLQISNKAITQYKVKAKVVSKEQFEQTVRSHTGDYWMAFSKETGVPILFSINILENDCCHYSTIKLDPAYKNSTYPMYGLLYTMNEYYLQKLGMRYVNDGARSLTEHSNIQPFLIEKFKFRKAYCHVQLIYKWWFGIIVKSLYPFRTFFKNPKVKGILKQEEIRRLMLK